MGIINDIFRTYAPAYLQRDEPTLPIEHKKTIRALCQCRTEATGSVCYQCEDCGHHRGLIPQTLFSSHALRNLL